MAINPLRTTYREDFVSWQRENPAAAGEVMEMMDNCYAHPDNDKLSFGSCGLREVPGFLIAAIPLRITELVLADNELTEAPAGLERLSLRVIYLKGNPALTSLESLMACQTLAEIHFADCAVRQLPKGIVGLKNLRWLNGSCNQLTALPEGLQLKHLAIAGNPITALPDDLGPLEVLDIGGTSIAAPSIPGCRVFTAWDRSIHAGH